ncbi:unnamed protein product [Rhodiola kirilowii]
MDCSFRSTLTSTSSSIIISPVFARISPLPLRPPSSTYSPISATRRLSIWQRRWSDDRKAARGVKASRCELGSSLNTPLEPRSGAGRYLGGVLQNDRKLFDAAVVKELRRLSDDREAAVARKVASEGSHEASLYRRIAELKDRENQIEVEDIMYMSILHKFSEIKVHLIPRLSSCIYNRRLEISPSKDWELESIYSYEVLELIREHVSGAIGLKVNSSVSDGWTITQIQQAQLGQVYAASILYGYFIKSASLRHHFEQSLSLTIKDSPLHQNASLLFPGCLPLTLKNAAQGNVCNIGYKPVSGLSYTQENQQEKLKFYMMGSNPEMLQRCNRLKSKESTDLVNSHSLALFGKEGSENSKAISTSFASLKRFVLEAVAFGYFLWDIEELVNSMYKLKESTADLAH